MIIETVAGSAYPTNATNITAASFTEPVPTTTTPSGDGVVAFGTGGMMACSAVKLIPFGVGADTNTFLMNCYGWVDVPAQGIAGDVTLWVPKTLATFSTITLNSNIPGVALTQVPATAYFAGAITLVTGNSGISVEVVSPGHAANEIAHIVLDVKGSKFLECRFSTGGSATSCNCLWAKM